MLRYPNAPTSLAWGGTGGSGLEILRYDRIYCDPSTGFSVVFDRDELDRDGVGFRNHEG
jgi:hypothetical protein